MPHPTVQAFMDRLAEAEQTGRIGPLAELFEATATLAGPSRDTGGTGEPGGAAEFWERYLATFARIRSRFTRVLEGEGFAVLEWVSEGALPSGRPVRYEGASVLELSGERIGAFRTYYDSAVFLPGGAKGTEPQHRSEARHPRETTTGGRRGPAPVPESPEQAGRGGGAGGRKGHHSERRPDTRHEEPDRTEP